MDTPDVDQLLGQARELSEAADASGHNTIEGCEGWLYFAPELRHMSVGKFWGDAAAEVSRASKPEQADPLPAILDFAEQLERVGIELIIVPVPTKASIYPEYLFENPTADGAGRIDPVHQEFFDMLRENGLQVFDPAEVFLGVKGDTQVFCRQDTHWSGAACELVAEHLARMIRDKPWMTDVPEQEFATLQSEVEITGDLLAGFDGSVPEKEKLSLRFVGTPGGATPAPVRPDAESPVILLGDSHNLVFHAGSDMHASGAGLPDQLAFELGFPVDLVAVRGSGATPARVNLLRRARRPGYLENKKLVIWCFTVREFTESSGWMKVPVVR